MKQVIFLFFVLLLPVLLVAQPVIDSTKQAIDSVAPVTISRYTVQLERIYQQNLLLNYMGKPVAMASIPKKRTSTDGLFYLIATLVALLAFLRVFYSRYFNTLFRVFFNTSLRQSQLTDQLLQAKLASLFFNSFFVISTGLYLYFLLLHYQLIPAQAFWKTAGTCVAGIGVIYTVKHLVLKFTGWITGFREVLNTYVFIVFLINKIIGILLVPFIIVMAFSEPPLKEVAAVLSLLLIGVMFLLRFFRSYGLLQHRIKVSRFHFFMYIAGIEVLPLLLIYKGLMVLLSKNL